MNVINEDRLCQQNLLNGKWLSQNIETAILYKRIDRIKRIQAYCWEEKTYSPDPTVYTANPPSLLKNFTPSSPLIA